MSTSGGKGYKEIAFRWHPRADLNGFVAEHILIAEKALGKFLPNGVIVHHVNQNKRDNTPRNLVICPNNAYHALLHVRTKIALAGGNPDTDKICSSCKNTKNLSSFPKDKSDYAGVSCYCTECKRRISRNYKIGRLNKKHSGVAQQAEQRSVKTKGVGSKPTSGATMIKKNPVWLAEPEKFKDCVLSFKYISEVAVALGAKNTFYSRTCVQRRAADMGVTITHLKSRKFKRKVVDPPTKEELIKLLESNSLATVGKKYSVCSSTIRKWLRRNEPLMVLSR